MMLTKKIDWHTYITETPYQAWLNSDDHAKYLALSSAMQHASAMLHGDLRYKNVAKQIVKEQTQTVAVRKGHPPYCFRFQCLQTGRKSKFIKESDYRLFGITKQDTINGGDYSQAQEIQCKMRPIINELGMKLSQMWRTCFGVGASSLWWQRYSEYLQSEEWYAIRQIVLERDGNKCLLTGSVSGLQIHHLTYERVGKEKESDLVTVASTAHKIIHDKSHTMHDTYSVMLANITSSWCVESVSE